MWDPAENTWSAKLFDPSKPTRAIYDGDDPHPLGQVILENIHTYIINI